MNPLLNPSKVSNNSGQKQLDNTTIVLFVVLLSIMMLLILASVDLTSKKSKESSNSKLPTNKQSVVFSLFI